MAERIIFNYYDSFTGDSLGSLDMPYRRDKAVNNYYSKLWKKTRAALSNIYRVKYCFVRMELTIVSNRIYESKTLKK